MDIFFSIGAALFFSLSQISVRRGVTNLGVPVGTAIMLVVGSIAMLIIAILVEGGRYLWPIDFESIFYFALAGVIHFLGGWGFQNASASRIGPTRLNALTASTPLFAVILAFISLNQYVNISIILGIFLIVIGIYSITMSEN